MSSGRGEMTVRFALQKKTVYETDTLRYKSSPQRGPKIDAVTCVLDRGSVGGHMSTAQELLGEY